MDESIVTLSFMESSSSIHVSISSKDVRDGSAAAAFDRLRKQYPPRHELHHWRHQGKVAPPLRALVSLLFESNASGSARPVPALHRPAGSSPR